MSDILSRVQILLDANTARFEQQMENAQDTSKTTFEKISDGAKMMGAAVAAGAVTGMTALVSYTDEHIKTITELERYAYLSDATFENFQRQAVGAQAAGLEIEQLSDIYKDFNEKLGEVNTVAGGGAVDFLEQVAIKTEGSAEAAMKLMKHMADLSGPEAMELYVKKMEEANLSQEQMSFLMESMASDTTALIPLLVNGAEGMHLWADAAEKAGVIINDETREAAKALSVEIKLLNMQMEGAKNQVMQAVLPAFVDIASAFLTTEGNTISLNGAADNLANTLRFLSKVGLGVISVFDIVGTIIGGSVAAMTSANVSAEDVILDLEAKIEGYGKKFEKIGGSGVSDADKKRLTEIEQERLKLQNQVTKSRQVDTDATKEWLDKQNEATDAVKAQAKAQDELNRKLKEQAQARDRITYDFSPRLTQMHADYLKQVQDINNAGFGADTQKYVSKADEQYELLTELYLRQQTEELNAHKWTEQQKTKYSFETKILEIQKGKEFTDELKQYKVQALQEQLLIEDKMIRISNEEKLLSARSIFLKESEIINWRYALEMKKLTEVKDAQVRNDVMLAESIGHLRGGVGYDQEFFSAPKPEDNLTNQEQLDDEYISQLSEMNNRYAQEQEIFKNNKQVLLQIESEYRIASAEMQSEYELKSQQARQSDYENQLNLYSSLLSQTSQVWGQMTQMVANAKGEQSKTYKAMFLAQQTIAMGQQVINTELAAMQPMAQMGIYGIPASFLIRGMGYASMAIIAAQTVAGIAHGGLDYVPEESTYLLDKGERVLSPRQNSDLTNFMATQKESYSQPKINVNITTLPGTTAKAEMNANGELNIEMIRKEMDEYIPYQLSKANSPISQAFSVNYATQRNR